MRTMTDDHYFIWLCRLIAVGPNQAPYIRLAEALHGETFAPDRNSMDMNRAYDGMNLRTEFYRKFGMQGSAGNRGSCTMLEMMVGLSKRIAFLMETAGKPKRIAEFFWKMVENLGLTGLTDDNFDKFHGDVAVKKAADHVNNRDYLPDGSGGLFHVSNPKQDLRTIEIWYQMHQWLNENYRSELL